MSTDWPIYLSIIAVCREGNVMYARECSDGKDSEYCNEFSELKVATKSSIALVM